MLREGMVGVSYASKRRECPGGVAGRGPEGPRSMARSVVGGKPRRSFSEMYGLAPAARADSTKAPRKERLSSTCTQRGSSVSQDCPGNLSNLHQSDCTKGASPLIMCIARRRRIVCDPGSAEAPFTHLNVLAAGVFGQRGCERVGRDAQERLQLVRALLQVR